MPDNLVVRTGILDQSTSQEIYVAVTNNGNSDSVLHSGHIGAQFVFISGADTASSSSEVLAFPTDQKVREQEARRAAKEAGQEVVRVKRKKFVEDHTDDCGEDLLSDAQTVHFYALITHLTVHCGSRFAPVIVTALIAETSSPRLSR